jgi:Transposase DDE domain
MSTTQQRGLEMAAKFKILKRPDGKWSVPSQTGKGHRYTIEMGDSPKCSCPYQETHDTACKHIFAVEYFLQRERHDDGSETVTETLTLTETVSRKTYRQNWPAYNAAQTTEKAEFQRLLYALCMGVESPQQTNGRPRIPLSDAVFSIAFKVFSTVSGRRFISDLADAHAKGYIQKVPHFNSIFDYLEMPELTPVLTDLIEESSLPLEAVETDFAVDSTGFGSSRMTSWYSTKYGDALDQHDWVKAHVCCGVKTNIVTAIRVTDRNTNDSPLLPELIQTTAENFHISEVSADKGYSSRTNTNAIGAWSARLEMCQWRRETLDKESIWGEARSTSLSKW